MQTTTTGPDTALGDPTAVLTLELLRRRLQQGDLTPDRRHSLQQEFAARSTPGQRAELDALLRRLPAAETADVRDLLYR